MADYIPSSDADLDAWTTNFVEDCVLHAALDSTRAETRRWTRDRERDDYELG